MDDDHEDEAPPGYSATPSHNPHHQEKDGGEGGGVPAHDGKAKKNKNNSEKDGLMRFLTKMAKLIKSMGGLICLLLAYTFFGAWVMVTIEGPAEVRQMQKVYNVRETISEKLKNNTDLLRRGALNETEWQRGTDDLLILLENTIHSSGVASTSKKKWTFLGAVLFCVTTYTTIGYGNIAPATDAGRIATMLYAVIGVPLALIVLADLGHRITVGLKFMWGFVRRYYYTGYCRKVRKRGLSKAHSQPDMNEAGVGDEAAAKQQQQGGAFSHNGAAAPAGTVYKEEAEVGNGGPRKRVDGASVYPVESSAENRSMTSTPRKDVLGNGRDSPGRSVSVERGSSCLGVQEGRRPGSRETSLPLDPSRRSQHSHSQSGSVFMEPAELSEDFKLPVLVAIAFIFVYIFAGAGLYRLWEDWTYLESFYFVFITTSTIGFGDVLPKHPNFFLLSCVYTFLGLALVSMTINVIIEWLSRTIDRAKVKVELARDKAMAKAKAATDKLTEVGHKARSKVLNTVGRDDSREDSREDVRDVRGVDAREEGKEKTESNGRNRAHTAGHDHRGPQHIHDAPIPTYRHPSPLSDRHPLAPSPAPDRLSIQEKGGGGGDGGGGGFDLPTPSSDNEASFRTAAEFAASSDSVNEQPDNK